MDEFLAVAGGAVTVLRVGLLFAAAAGAQTVWDGAYTEAQASRGVAAFGRSCAGCHALAVTGKSALVGDIFWKSFSQKTVGEMLEWVSANMPNGAPRSLSVDAYQDIAAAMLQANGLPGGTREVAAGVGMMIVPKDGGSELPANALVRVVGCLVRSGADWTVTRATEPERAERVRTAAEDAARALGGRTLTLKYVLTKLDALAGARVVVTGLLMGAGGADGINVTGVTRVAAGCP